VSKPDNNDTTSQMTSIDDEAIRHFRNAIASGKHWYLDYWKQWVGGVHRKKLPGRHYQYLIEGFGFRLAAAGGKAL